MTDSTENEQGVNYFDMSDEELDKLEMPTEPSTHQEELGEDDEQEDQTSEGGDPDSESGQDVGSTEEASQPDTESSTDDDQGSESSEGETETGDSEEQGQSGKTDGELDDDGQLENKEEKEDKDKTPSEVENYKQIMAPFKANGRQMEAKSVEEVRRLMSMGANYNSKMASLKPNLKLLKMLSNNDILDEKKLSYLIDLSKKDPAAITQLIKDSNVDPLDIDVEKDTGYTPKSYTVSDNEVDLDHVLADVQNTDTGERTLEILSTKWDNASKEMLAQNPSIISIINEQVGTGIFDEISDEIARSRALGNYTGMSDIEAYKQVGNHMQANRLFKGMAQAPANNTTAATDTLVKPRPKAEDLQLKKRKKAASATTGSVSQKTNLTDLDVLNMSDEEFDKLAAPT